MTIVIISVEGLSHNNNKNNNNNNNNNNTGGNLVQNVGTEWVQNTYRLGTE
jgi:hypothetical protein